MKNNWKKRLLAALLTAIFVVTLLPVGAFAYGPFDSVPLNLRISSYGAPFWNPNEQSHSVNPLNWTKYIRRDAVGSNNANGSARAYFQGSNENGWQLYLDVKIGNYNGSNWAVSGAVPVTYTVKCQTLTQKYPVLYDGNEPPAAAAGAQNIPEDTNTYEVDADVPVSTQEPALDGYDFLGWAQSPSGDVVTGTVKMVEGGLTFYARWREAGGQPGEAPKPPSAEEIARQLEVVTLYCETKPEEHPQEHYETKADSIEVDEPRQGADDVWTVTARVYAGSYVDDYNANIAPGHNPTRTYQTITLTWFQTGDDPEGAWDVTGGSPVSFTLKCDGTGPDDPEPSHSTGSSGGGAPDRFYTIVSSADEGGQIVREGVQKIREATDRRFSIYPDEGWEIDEVLVDGRPAKLEEDDKYWFREVRRDHTIHVSFRQIVPAQAPEAKPVPSTGAI
ncbi:hypothetical protein [Anaerotruncus rubiinfantis]|uniref:hypothetical protein n=3 Tax=Anaerotruncus rubiinfantis TaxID=1720200 RepID=UPI0034A2CA2C